jgi:hypothetical protein
MVVITHYIVVSNLPFLRYGLMHNIRVIAAVPPKKERRKVKIVWD